MGFFTQDDYTVLVRNEIKGMLLENYTNARLSTAEQMGITQVKNYLSGRYDVGAIFSTQGNERNQHIVMITLDCILYHLYTATIPDRMPEIRSQRYGDALDWLKMIANGNADADLPPKKNDQGKELQGMKISSKYKPNNNKW